MIIDGKEDMWLARHVDQPDAIFLALLYVGDRQGRVRAPRIPAHTIDKDRRRIVSSRDIICIDVIPRLCQTTDGVCGISTCQSSSVIIVESRTMSGDIED